MFLENCQTEIYKLWFYKTSQNLMNIIKVLLNLTNPSSIWLNSKYNNLCIFVLATALALSIQQNNSLPSPWLESDVLELLIKHSSAAVWPIITIIVTNYCYCFCLCFSQCLFLFVYFEFLFYDVLVWCLGGEGGRDGVGGREGGTGWVRGRDGVGGREGRKGWGGWGFKALGVLVLFQCLCSHVWKSTNKKRRNKGKPLK